MPKPYFYINVHQTIWVMLALAAVSAYVFDYKGVRKDINEALFR